jgi:hypothetical protein
MNYHYQTLLFRSFEHLQPAPTLINNPPVL